jgi:hypothetical protein
VLPHLIQEIGLLVIADKLPETRFEPDLGVVKRKTHPSHWLKSLKLGISELNTKKGIKKMIIFMCRPFFIE